MLWCRTRLAQIFSTRYQSTTLEICSLLHLIGPVRCPSGGARDVGVPASSTTKRWKSRTAWQAGAVRLGGRSLPSSSSSVLLQSNPALCVSSLGQCQPSQSAIGHRLLSLLQPRLGGGNLFDLFLNLNRLAIEQELLLHRLAPHHAPTVSTGGPHLNVQPALKDSPSLERLLLGRSSTVASS